MTYSVERYAIANEAQRLSSIVHNRMASGKSMAEVFSEDPRLTGQILTIMNLFRALNMMPDSMFDPDVLALLNSSI